MMDIRGRWGNPPFGFRTSFSRVTALGAFLLLPLLAGCGSEGETAEGAVARSGSGAPGMGAMGAGGRAIPVAARIARPGALQVTLRGSTNLRAREQVDVVPRQGGVVARLTVEEGDRVREGDLLAQLDDEEWRLQAQQSAARARSAADAATRGRALAAQDILSVQELERLISDSAVARADAELAELRVRNAQIRSPISGVVTHRYVDRGSQVGANTTVFAVADLDRLEAQLAIPERDAPRVVVGQEARVIVDEGVSRVVTGRVERIRPVVDPGSGTVQVTVVVESGVDSPLRPGQFVNVDIVTETLADRITLPRTAVLVDGAVPRVFILNGDVAVEREVQLGFSRGDQVEIRSGVEPGDTVVVVGQDNLRPNVTVLLMNLDGENVERGTGR